MATVNNFNNVSENTNNTVKGECIMKTVTLTKRGVGTVVFSMWEDGNGKHYGYTPIGCKAGYEVDYSVQKGIWDDHCRNGFTLKVNTESRKESPKATKSPKEDTPKEVKRYTWCKEGRRIWATQFNIYKKALILGGYAKELKGREFHDAVDSMAKKLMKEHEERTYKLVNAIIANNQ